MVRFFLRWKWTISTLALITLFLVVFTLVVGWHGHWWWYPAFIFVTALGRAFWSSRQQD